MFLSVFNVCLFFPFFKLTVFFLQKECLFFSCFCDYEEKYIDTFLKAERKIVELLMLLEVVSRRTCHLAPQQQVLL